MSLRPGLALAVFLSCSIAPAQQARAERASAFGEVLDLHGQPWAGAQVILLSELAPRRSGSFGFDRIETRSDARGRFRADLLLQRNYVGYAIEDAAPGQQARRCSHPVRMLRARERVQLRESRRRVSAGAAQLANTAAHVADGPFRIEIQYDLGQGFATSTQVQADETVPIAAWPGTIHIRVFDRLQRLRGFQRGSSGRPATRKLRILALAGRGFEIVDDKGAPVAGAEVFSREPLADGRLVRVGRSDAKGQIRSIKLGLRAAMGTMATAPGFAFTSFYDFGRRRKNVDQSKPRRLQLIRIPEQQLQLRLAPNQEPPGMRILRDRPMYLIREGQAAALPLGGSVMGFVPQLLPIIAGKLPVTGDLKGPPPQLVGARLTTRVLFDSKARRQLPASWRHLLPWHLELPEECLRPLIGGTLSLRSCLPLRVRVFDHRGNPVSGAGVSLGVVRDRSLYDAGVDSSAFSLSDRSGRAHLLLPPHSATIRLIARYPADTRQAHSFAQALVRSDQGPDQLEFSELRLRLSAPLRIHGQIKDSKGKPLAKVKVRLGPPMDKPIAMLVHDDPDTSAEPQALDQSAGRLRWRILDIEDHSLSGNRRYHRIKQVLTDARGRFSFLLPQPRKNQELKLQLSCESSFLGMFRRKAAVDLQIDKGKPLPPQVLVLK